MACRLVGAKPLAEPMMDQFDSLTAVTPIKYKCDSKELIDILQNQKYLQQRREEKLLWMSNYTHHKVQDEITYPFPSINRCLL